MPNAKDSTVSPWQKFFVVGPTGSGKSSQILTLPGRKFAYLFDPNAIVSIVGHDVDYEQFLVEPDEADFLLKGFNKGSKDDKGKKAIEPVSYLKWNEHWNNACTTGFWDNYDWLCFDSLTLFKTLLMSRQLFLNGRMGGLEDLADYRVAGNKIASNFQTITSMPINLFCTGHLNSFQDEKTKRVGVELDLPGSARKSLPILFSNIWELRATHEDKQEYVGLTRAEPRGFQSIRNTVQGLPPVVDLTIKDFKNPQNYGIGALLVKNGKYGKRADWKNAKVAGQVATAMQGAAKTP